MTGRELLAKVAKRVPRELFSMLTGSWPQRAVTAAVVGANVALALRTSHPIAAVATNLGIMLLVWTLLGGMLTALQLLNGEGRQASQDLIEALEAFNHDLVESLVSYDEKYRPLLDRSRAQKEAERRAKLKLV